MDNDETQEDVAQTPIAIRTLPDPMAIIAIIKEVGEIFGDARAIWWRGHSNGSFVEGAYEWELQPGAFRYDGDDANVRQREHTFIGQFVEGMGSRGIAKGSADETLDRLLLMQHHGFPTRLLDWSKSVLTALYFAAGRTSEKHKESEGMLWALNPYELNRAFLGSPNIVSKDDEHVSDILHEVMNIKSEREALEFENRHIISIFAEQNSPRMQAQQAKYTLHGTPQPLETYPDASRYLVRVRIPAGLKEGVILVLNELGVDESQLFPDLDHLSEYVKWQHKYLDYGKPQ